MPPLSIIVDALGVHYDPSRPSTLETMLTEGEFAPDLLARAAQLRALIVTSGVSKYEVGGAALARPGGARRHILVPGQVEDDRSVLAGAGEVRGNLDLLRRARAAEPDAHILYKPHRTCSPATARAMKSRRTRLPLPMPLCRASRCPRCSTWSTASM